MLKAVGVFIAGIVLVCLVFAEKTDPVVDDAVRDIFAMESRYEEALFSVPPVPSMDVFVHSVPKTIAVDWSKFPKDFKTRLFASMDEQVGVPLYTVLVYQDYITRETVFENLYGEEIYRLPPPEGFDVIAYLWMVTGRNLALMDPFNRWIFDPAHTAVEFTSLVPEIFYADYQAAQEELATQNTLVAMEAAAFPMMMQMMSASTNEFLMLQDGTNLSVNLPSEFAGATISLESKTNLLDSGWATVFETNAPASGILPLGAADLPDVPCEMIITTNSETIYIDPINGSTNVIPEGVYTNYEYSTIAAFYRAAAASTNDADADGLDNVSEYCLGTDYQDEDTDDDTLGDGEEVLFEGTNPLVVDTDGDGLTDWQESETYNTNNWSGTDPLDPDTDGDGLSDFAESGTYNTNNWTGTDPLNADSDNDGMWDGYEFNFGLNPTNSADVLVDADGDHIPNLYEYMNGQTDPTNALSFPLPTAVATTNAQKAATNATYHLTIQSAVDAVTNNTCPIVLIEPGTYTGIGNKNVSLDDMEILIYGTNAATVIDCQGAGNVFSVDGGRPVISGFVMQRGRARAGGAIDAWGNTALQIRNCVFINNYAWDYGGAVYLSSGPDAVMENCTLVDNYGSAYGGAVCGGGTSTELGLQMRNCLVWDNSTYSGKSSDYSQVRGVSMNHSCIEGGFRGGENDLPGTAITTNDPHLVQHSWRLASTNSSCLGTGSAVYAPSMDIDGEIRLDVPEIGADEFIDSDSDGLPDWWEAETGATSATVDEETVPDGLDNLEEYLNGSHPFLRDTDGDELSDYDEVMTYGTIAFDSDSDGDDMPDGYELDYGLNPLAGSDALANLDGDHVPNVYECVHGSDPTNSLSFPGPTVVVSPNGHSDTFSTIEDAMDAAVLSNAYPMVLLEPGTYIGTGNKEINVTLPLGQPHMMVYGTNSTTVIDCEDDGRAFRIELGHMVFSGLVFQNGYALPVFIPPFYWSMAHGGAIDAWGDNTSLNVRNCLFFNNTTDFGDGGAINNRCYSAPVLEHCSFINNHAADDAGAVYAAYGGAIRNCLVWGNTAEDPWAPAYEQIVDGWGLGDVTYSCVEGGYEGEGNISADPRLIYGSWRLATVDSSCFDSGNPTNAVLWDIDGDSRAARMDIGADQFADDDQDGLPDAWEWMVYGSTNYDGSADYDGDSLNDLFEITEGLDALLADADGDGVDDDVELKHGCDPLLTNSYDSAWPYDEDFENLPEGSVDGLEGWMVAAGSASNQSLVAHGGSNALHIADGAIVSHFTETPTNRMVWVDMQINPMGTTAAPSNALGEALMYIDDAGGFMAWNSGSSNWSELAIVTTGSWNRLTLKLDYDVLDWDVWINGQNVATNLGFADASIDQFNVLPLPSGELYVDDVLADGSLPLSGTATYNGPLTNSITVMLVENENEWDTANAVAVQIIETAGDYCFTNVAMGDYYLKAFLDWDGDGFRDQYESWGTNSAIPYILGRGFDVAVDQEDLTSDFDGDGSPDYLDAFPEDDAAWIDTDGDGMPDELHGTSTSQPPLVEDDDDDNDLLPDEWEIQYGLDRLSGEGIDGAGGDADHDGVSNLDEYNAETHPRIDDFTPTGGASATVKYHYDVDGRLLDSQYSGTAAKAYRYSDSHNIENVNTFTDD